MARKPVVAANDPAPVEAPVVEPVAEPTEWTNDTQTTIHIGDGTWIEPGQTVDLTPAVKAALAAFHGASAI